MRTTAEHSERVAQWIAGYTLTWEHLWAGRDLTVLSWPPDGAPPLGPLYLVLLPVAAVFCARRLDLTRRALVLGGLVGVALWLPGYQSSRYLLPALVPVIPLMADGLVQLLTTMSRPVRRAVVAMLAFLAAWNLQLAVAPVEVDRLAATLGQRPVDSVLDRWVSSWPAVRWINANLPEDACVLLVAEARSLLLDRDVVLEQAIHEPLLVELAESRPSAEAVARALADRGVTHVLYNRQDERRMLAMAGGQHFLETSSPAADARLERFFVDWLEELWRQGGVSVYRLREIPMAGRTPDRRAGASKEEPEA
jgi:hypothetical protein